MGNDKMKIQAISCYTHGGTYPVGHACGGCFDAVSKERDTLRERVKELENGCAAHVKEAKAFFAKASKVQLSICESQEQEIKDLRVEVKVLDDVIKRIFPYGHDLVCSGDRSMPVGVRGHSCSCVGRLLCKIEELHRLEEEKQEAVKKAVEEERERCERIAYAHNDSGEGGVISSAIREGR